MVFVRIPPALVLNSPFEYRGIFVAIAVSKVVFGLFGYVWARRELNRDVREGCRLSVST